MSTSTTLPTTAVQSNETFWSALVSALPIVILYRAVRGSGHSRTRVNGSLQTAASH